MQILKFLLGICKKDTYIYKGVVLKYNMSSFIYTHLVFESQLYLKNCKCPKIILALFQGYLLF